jgi:DNA polymerase-3 subunit epsilon
MIVLGLDFETSGLNPDVDRILEVGAILWNTADGGFPMSFVSEFCYDDSMNEAEFSKEALEANSLKMEYVKTYGKPFASIFKFLGDEAHAVVAHNGSKFDYFFYKAECKRAGLVPWNKVWIDTITDVHYPEKMTTRKLTHLAAEHNFLNPFPHRAVMDVLTMLKIFQQYDPEIALEYAKQPVVVVQAMVSFDDKQKAKDRNYRWDADKKRWVKEIKLPELAKEKADAGFPIRELRQIEMDWSTA